MTFADHLNRARNAVDAALGHHDDAVDAYDRNDQVAVKTAHANLRRCLRSAQQAFRTMAADQEINGKTKLVATSNGVAESGGSANGRGAGSPLLRGNAGLQDWLDRARLAGSRR